MGFEENDVMIGKPIDFVFLEVVPMVEGWAFTEIVRKKKR
jgi:hypothetical protein